MPYVEVKLFRTDTDATQPTEIKVNDVAQPDLIQRQTIHIPMEPGDVIEIKLPE